jgi:hypothetical protein
MIGIANRSIGCEGTKGGIRNPGRWVIPAALLGLVCAGTVRCDGESATEHCDVAALQAALDAASPGSTVRMGACRLSGWLTVPAGVTLAGRGPGASILKTVGIFPALRITPGSTVTRVVDLSVESAEANSAVFVLPGTGSAAVERVRIAAGHGFALAAEGVGSLALTGVTLTGPVTPANHLGWSDDPTETATHGLALVRVGNATLSDVTASGFALFGALLVDCSTTWTGGGAPRNLGTGVMVYRGEAELHDLDLSGTLDGDRLMPAYGAVFAGDDTTEANVESSGLVLSGGDDAGLLQQKAVGLHRDLVAADNGGAGVWVQNCSSFELNGETRIEGNTFSGVVGIATQRMVVDGGEIATTQAVSHVVSEGGSEPVGDGIHFVRDGAGTLEVRDVTLRTNDRVGLLLELRGGGTDGITLSGVEVSGTGEALGVYAQHGTATAGWDTGVTRDPVTTTNDATPRAPVGFMPSVATGEMPGAAAVATGGLAGVVVPDPPH